MKQGRKFNNIQILLICHKPINELSLYHTRLPGNKNLKYKCDQDIWLCMKRSHTIWLCGASPWVIAGPWYDGFHHQEERVQAPEVMCRLFGRMYHLDEKMMVHRSYVLLLKIRTANRLSHCGKNRWNSRGIGWETPQKDIFFVVFQKKNKKICSRKCFNFN